MLSQIDSNILQSLGIPGRILVPPVTQLFKSKWLHFFFQWSLRKGLLSNHGNHPERPLVGRSY